MQIIKIIRLPKSIIKFHLQKNEHYKRPASEVDAGILFLYIKFLICEFQCSFYAFYKVKASFPAEGFQFPGVQGGIIHKVVAGFFLIGRIFKLELHSGSPGKGFGDLANGNDGTGIGNIIGFAGFTVDNYRQKGGCAVQGIAVGPQLGAGTFHDDGRF